MPVRRPREGGGGGGQPPPSKNGKPTAQRGAGALVSAFRPNPHEKAPPESGAKWFHGACRVAMRPTGVCWFIQIVAATDEGFPGLLMRGRPAHRSQAQSSAPASRRRWEVPLPAQSNKKRSARRVRSARPHSSGEWAGCGNACRYPLRSVRNSHGFVSGAKIRVAPARVRVVQWAKLRLA